MKLLISILFLTPNLNAALTEGDADEAPGLCMAASPLQKGRAAPCTGVLWGINQTRQALTCVKANLPECENDLSLCRDLSSAQAKTHEALLSSCNQTVIRYRALLDDAIPVSVSTPWYQTPVFIAILSTATFAGGVWLGAAL